VRLERPERVSATIPTASLADIAFLLIIFFMVATVHHMERTSVELPYSGQRTEAQRDAAVVRLLKDPDSGSLTYQFSDPTSTKVVGGPEDVYLEASRVTYRYPAQQFILEADRSVHFEKIDELLDQMRRGGVQNVLFLTQQRTIGGAP